MADRSTNSKDSLPSTSTPQAMPSATSSSAEAWRERLASSTEFIPNRREHQVDSPMTSHVTPALHDQLSQTAPRVSNSSEDQPIQNRTTSQPELHHPQMQNASFQQVPPQIMYNRPVEVDVQYQQMQSVPAPQVTNNMMTYQYMPVQYPQVVQYPQALYPMALYPQGQYMPAQYPQVQYPQVQYPQVQYPQGQYSQGQYSQGQYSQGQYSQGQYPYVQGPSMQLPSVQFIPIRDQPVHMAQSHTGQGSCLPEQCQEIETESEKKLSEEKESAEEKKMSDEEKKSEKLMSEKKPHEVQSVETREKMPEESQSQEISLKEKTPEKEMPVARRNPMKSVLRRNIQAHASRRRQEQGRGVHRSPPRAPSAPQSSIQITPEELDLDALFIGNDTANLPGLGEVSRTDFQSNKEEYTRIVMDHQHNVLNAIEDKETSSTQEEQFVVVPKNKSVGTSRFSEKTQEAVRAAAKEARREMIIGGVKLSDSFQQSQSDQVATEHPKKLNSEPCTSSSALEATTSGASGATQVPKMKSSNKGGKKGDEGNQDKEEWFDEATHYNMNSALDEYYAWRDGLHRTNVKYPVITPESEQYKLEKKLFENAKKRLANMSVVDSSLKAEFCMDVACKLPILELPKEQLAALSKFYSLLSERNDETFLLDCHVLSKSMKASEAEAVYTLSLYYVVCMEHAPLMAARKGMKLPRLEAAQSTSSRATTDQVEKKEADLVAKLERFFDFRRYVRQNKFTPPNTSEDSKEATFVNALILGARDHSGEFTERDTKLKNVIINHILLILPTLSFRAAIHKDILAAFFTYLLERTDDVLLMDIPIIHEYCKKFPEEKSYYLWLYYNTCMRNSL